MSSLQWSEELVLDLPLMDETHQEFVELLQAVNAADDATLQDCWNTLVEHTDQHFAQEDRWMLATKFASSNCHTLQHKVVLQVMREGGERAAKGELFVLREMARELAIWLVQHTQSMDAALALHLRRVGFDPVTGTVASPDNLPRDLIHGCAGACSGDDEEEAGQAADAVH